MRPLVCGVALLMSLWGRAHAQPIDPENVADAMWNATTWQLANNASFQPLDWRMGPFYDGLLNAAEATGEAAYMGEAIGFGQTHAWGLLERNLYNADDHAVAHAWLDLYEADPIETRRLTPILERFQFILANPETQPVAFGGLQPARNRWTWCDALYMGPPTVVRLHSATGDPAYLSFLDQEWAYTHSGLPLWEASETLYFRDSRFVGVQAANGELEFWSRGNGWVFAGLALTLDHLPPTHPNRAFYETTFQQMAAKLVSVQRADGLWTPNLLDPNDPDVGETSGSAFFVFGLAWGLRHGLLDAPTYTPAMELGWQGLVTRQRPDGAIGWVQQVGQEPGPADAMDTETYGTGAFLLAGAEVIKLIRPEQTVTLAELVPQAEVYIREVWDIRRLRGLTVIDASGDDGNPPDRAFDGVMDVPENRWSVAGLGTPQFVEVDLGATRALEGVIVDTRNNRDYQYTIETRLEGEPFGVIVDRSANTDPGPIEDLFQHPIRARYLRITVTGAHTYAGPWVSLQEVRLLVKSPVSAPRTPPAGVRSIRLAPRR